MELKTATRRGGVNAVLLSFVVLATIVAVSFVMSESDASADTTVVTIDETLYYLNDDGTATAFGYYDIVNLVIPETITVDGKEYVVTAIDDYAFDYCEELRSVVIPDTVTSLGDYAFAYCDNLTSVDLGEGLTTINRYAFWGSDSLETITIPASVTYIGNGPFGHCDSLLSIFVDPANQQFMSSEGALFTKDGTILIQHPMGLTGDYAIPDGVIAISDYAFDYTSLTTISVPASVEAIGLYAFFAAGSLKAIEVDPANQRFTSIDGVLFTKDGTEIIVAPNGFAGDYTIPDGVIRISDHAFDSCEYMTSVAIPKSVESIGYCAFCYCTDMESILIDPDNPHYKSMDGILFTKDGSTLVQFPCGVTESYTVPHGVTTIGEYAFSGASLSNVILPDSIEIIMQGAFEGSSIESVDLGQGVMEIRYDAFYDCDSLTSVKIPDSVVTIDDYAFNDCDNLVSVALGSGLVDIGYRVFSYTSLNYLNIPEAVESIDPDAFYWIPTLLAIDVDPDNRNYVSIDGVLFTKDMTTLIQYPAGKVDTSYEIPDGVTEISDAAFIIATNLRNVTIPDSVTTIGWRAFWECTSLENVYIPASVTDVGADSFHDVCGTENGYDPEPGTYVGHQYLDGKCTVCGSADPDSADDDSTPFGVILAIMALLVVAAIIVIYVKR